MTKRSTKRILLFIPARLGVISYIEDDGGAKIKTSGERPVVQLYTLANSLLYKMAVIILLLLIVLSGIFHW